MTSASPRNLLLGQLQREYLLNPSGEAFLDYPGGDILYAAAGLAVWGETAGLVSRIGEDYPRRWLEQISERGFNVGGVRILPEAKDLRAFIAYTEDGQRHRDNPVGHFARLEISFPKSLLGYKDDSGRSDSPTQRSPLSLRQSDLPEDFLSAGAAHLCPMDYLSHNLMPAVLRQHGLTTITLDPGRRYMNAAYWEHIPALLPGLTAFMPSEERLRALFQGRTEELREMVAAISAYDCELIVIKRGALGQMLYDSASGTYYEIPAYPARVTDPTGAGAAFCGGFLAGYRRSFDPLQAVLYGNVSASLVIEGSGPFYALDILPGLAEARLQSLQEAVRLV